ncbi:MAG: hypothetical protein K2X27_20080 [Candidatus Obscuribacterales bacterium]|nr:hypothetical protein [Candidatus Obscuribacterales bacterium]
MNNCSDYERLRSWYLARLRKLSLESNIDRSLTPAALISADRENIEQLIMRNQENQLKARSNGNFLLRDLLFNLLVYALLLALVSCFLPVQLVSFNNLALVYLFLLFLLEPFIFRIH